MRERWQRIGLWAAGAWNVLGGMSAVVDPDGHFATMYTTRLDLADPLQAFFFTCVWINVIAWGAAYWIAAQSPAARRPVLLAGGAGKIAYALACFALYNQGVARPMVLVAGAVDLALVALFAWVLWGSPKTDAASQGSPALG